MVDFFNQYIFHWTPDKAVFISGHPLFWDARCAGIYIGLGVGLVWHFLVGRKARYLPGWPILLLNTIMFCPMFVDIFSIWLNLRKPSNEIRLLTGIFFGGALIVYIYPVFISLFTIKNEPQPAISSISSYITFLLVNLTTFLIKELNNGFAYYFLQMASVIGFGGLIFIFSASILKVLFSLYVKLYQR